VTGRVLHHSQLITTDQVEVWEGVRIAPASLTLQVRRSVFVLGSFFFFHFGIDGVIFTDEALLDLLLAQLFGQLLPVLLSHGSYILNLKSYATNAFETLCAPSDHRPRRYTPDLVVVIDPYIGHRRSAP